MVTGLFGGFGGGFRWGFGRLRLGSGALGDRSRGFGGSSGFGGAGFGGGGFGGSLGGHLLLQGGGKPGHLRGGRVEQPGRLGQVGLHRSGQLGQQDLAGFQVSDALDLGDGQRAAVHVAALDDQSLVVLGELLDRLGRVNGLATDERDRGRSDEQLVEASHARFRGGPLDQRVLGDRVRRRTRQRPAQFGQVGDRQTAILGDHGRG